METIKQITELAKSLTPDSVKFDKDLFDKARKALADLIVVEANEMTTEGSDERMSIAHLMEAVNHLLAWYEGEKEEGEVTEIEEVVKADMPICEDGKCGKCAECMSDKADMPDCADGKCGKCSKCMSEKAPEVPNTTEEEETDQATIKSVDAEVVEEAPVVEESTIVAEQISEAIEVAETTSLEDVVEKAVKSAMESVKAEIDTLRAEKESAVEKSVKLESELATALSKAIAGGPKRTAIKMSDEAQKDLLVKAATYKAKADATTDPVLAKGYRALHAEFIAKANPKAEN
jgi:chaperonin cofactor prefoldin